MPSVNADIRDMVIQHQHYLERYKTAEVRAIRRLLNEADTQLRTLLSNTEMTQWNRRRYQALLDSVHQIEAGTAARLESSITSSAKALGQVEAQALGKIVDAAAGDLLAQSAFSFNVPGVNTIWAAANANPLLLNENVAVLLQNYIGSISRSRLLALDRSLRYSFAMGESMDEARRRIFGTATRRGAIDMSRRTAEAVTRTSMNHLSSVARHQTYHQNQDVINGYQWVSTLDRRTSDICQDRDGNVWYFTDAEITTGAILLPGEVYPPAHVSCRSSTCPIVKSWRALGIDRDKFPESTRASMNGQVPESTTYYQWLERQPAAVQREVLGATRYHMYSQQGVSFKSFHATDGRVMTLDQLGARGYTVPSRRVVMSN